MFQGIGMMGGFRPQPQRTKPPEVDEPEEPAGEESEEIVENPRSEESVFVVRKPRRGTMVPRQRLIE
jgi:hypothetical protein